MYTDKQILEYEDCTYSEELTSAIEWCRKNNATCDELVDKRKEVNIPVEVVDEETGEKTTEVYTKLMRYFQINVRSVPVFEPTDEEKAEELKAIRNQYLADTDFTQLADVPLSDEFKVLYRDYRQYLRDIPENSEFPNIEVKTFEDWKNSLDNSEKEEQTEEVKDDFSNL